MPPSLSPLIVALELSERKLLCSRWIDVLWHFVVRCATDRPCMGLFHGFFQSGATNQNSAFQSCNTNKSNLFCMYWFFRAKIVESVGGDCPLFAPNSFSSKPVQDKTMGLTQSLFKATAIGDLTQVRQLLDRGANVHAVDESGWTPLHQACSNGHRDIVGELLDRGASIHSKDKHGFSPIHHASWNGYIHVVNELLVRTDARHLSLFLRNPSFQIICSVPSSSCLFLLPCIYT